MTPLPGSDLHDDAKDDVRLYRDDLVVAAMVHAKMPRPLNDSCHRIPK